MKNIIFFTQFCLILLLSACTDPDPNVDKTGKDEFKSYEVDHPVNSTAQLFHDVIYVPIYSNIYIDQQNQKNLLAATLSIRNTSYADSLFVSKIDYFNTDGNLVRSYIENLISLPPMGTINYVIEKEDDLGGAGANFIVELSAENNGIKPLIQAIMIGQTGNKAFSFVVDGYSLGRGNKK